MKKATPKSAQIPLKLRAALDSRLAKFKSLPVEERDRYLMQPRSDREGLMRWLACYMVLAQDEQQLASAFASSDRAKLDKSREAEEEAARLAGSNLVAAWYEVAKRISAAHLQIVSDVLQVGANYNQIGRLRLSRDPARNKKRARSHATQVKRDILEARSRCRELEYFWRAMEADKSVAKQSRKTPVALCEDLATSSSIEPGGAAELRDILEQVEGGRVTLEDAAHDICSLFGASMS